MQRLQPLKNVQFALKIKMAKNMRKGVVQEDENCSVQKENRLKKNKQTKYSRNETFLKIGHIAKAVARAKAIAFAKWSVGVNN